MTRSTYVDLARIEGLPCPIQIVLDIGIRNRMHNGEQIARIVGNIRFNTSSSHARSALVERACCERRRGADRQTESERKGCEKRCDSLSHKSLLHHAGQTPFDLSSQLAYPSAEFPRKPT